MSALQKLSDAKLKTCWIDLLFIAKVFVFIYADFNMNNQQTENLLMKICDFFVFAVFS